MRVVKSAAIALSILASSGFAYAAPSGIYDIQQDVPVKVSPKRMAREKHLALLTTLIRYVGNRVHLNTSGIASTPVGSPLGSGTLSLAGDRLPLSGFNALRDNLLSLETDFALPFMGARADSTPSSSHSNGFRAGLSVTPNRVRLALKLRW